MLDGLNPAMQRLDIVGGHDGDRLLSDNRPMINVFINEVDGDTGRLDTIRQSFFDGASTRESWKQGGVDIHDTLREPSHGFYGENSHESSEDYEFNLVAIQQIADGGGKRGPIRVVGPVDDLRRDPGGLCPEQTARAMTV